MDCGRIGSGIHALQLEKHGGMEGVRDRGMLSSALARPQNLLAYSSPQPDFADLAAAYAFGIAKNHPFVDGNKRTAHVVYRTYLLLNGLDVIATQEKKYSALIKLADGSWSDADFAAWIRRHLQQV